MSTIHEINEGWQEFALQPTWAQLHQAQTEYDYLRSELQAARQEISEQARVNAMGAEREARLMARINGLEKALRELHDATRLVGIGHYDQEAHDIAVSRAIAALEKKHEDR